jgi:hypothetical protein
MRNNFTEDLYISDATPIAPQELLVVIPAPIGSYLVGRGKRFDFIRYDIHKNLRGMADKGFNIGA